jgi:hypothetical protein
MKYGWALVVNSLTILIGWLGVAAGFVILLTLIQDDLITGIVSGGAISLLGLTMVTLGQMANAMIETAEESRKTNKLLRQMLQSQVDQPLAVKLPSQPENKNMEKFAPKNSSVNNEKSSIKTYRDYKITTTEHAIEVEGLQFADMISAEKWVDDLIDTPVDWPPQKS